MTIVTMTTLATGTIITPSKIVIDDIVHTKKESCVSIDDSTLILCSDDDDSDNFSSSSKMEEISGSFSTDDGNMSNDMSAEVDKNVCSKRSAARKPVENVSDCNVIFTQSVQDGVSPVKDDDNHSTVDYFQRYFPRRKMNCQFHAPKYLIDPKVRKTIPVPRTRNDEKDTCHLFKHWYDKLKESEKEVFDEFRQITKNKRWYNNENIDVHEKSSFIVDDKCLLRYLVARKFDIPKTLAMLENSLQWQKEYFPNHCHCELCDQKPEKHCTEFIGWDLQSRPILFVLPPEACADALSPKATAQHYIEEFEICIHNMSLEASTPAQEKWVAIADCTTFSYWKHGKIDMAKTIISILQDQYPERLGAAFFINPPTSFWMLWKAASIFIDPDTREKIHFLYTNTEPNVNDALMEHFPKHVSEFLKTLFNK